MAGKPIHGMAGSPEHRSWTGMKSRCQNPNDPRWHRYGGRGIRVCARWLKSFENFYADMGSRPQGTSLERKDNNGNYGPGNCIWATPREQSNNMRRNVHIEYQGQRRTIAQWEYATGISRITIRARLRRGWGLDDVFSSDVSRDAHKRKRT